MYSGAKNIADDVEAPTWPVVDPIEADFINALIPHLRQRTLTINGQLFTVTHLPHWQHQDLAFRMTGTVNQYPVTISLDRNRLNEFLQLPLNQDDFASLPSGLRQGLTSAAILDSLTDVFERIGCSFELDEVSLQPEADTNEKTCRFGFALQPQTTSNVYHGVIELAPSLAAQFTNELHKTPLQLNNSRFAIAEMRIPARLILGQTTLSIHDLQTAVCADILLFTPVSAKQYIVTLLIGAFFHYSAEFDGEVLTLMQENEPPSDDDGKASPRSTAKQIGDLNVTLTIELDSIDLTVAEIARLDVGSTIPLNRPADALVQLKQNDKIIGRGQIVNIGGQLGVRITHILAHDNG